MISLQRSTKLLPLALVFLSFFSMSAWAELSLWKATDENVPDRRSSMLYDHWGVLGNQPFSLKPRWPRKEALLEIPEFSVFSALDISEQEAVAIAIRYCAAREPRLDLPIRWTKARLRIEMPIFWDARWWHLDYSDSDANWAVWITYAPESNQSCPALSYLLLVGRFGEVREFHPLLGGL